MVRMKASNLTGLSEGSLIFQQYFIINMKNTMKKIKYIFKVLKYVVFCVFYKTFYNLQNSVKLPPKCRKCMTRTLGLNDKFILLSMARQRSTTNYYRDSIRQTSTASFKQNNSSYKTKTINNYKFQGNVNTVLVLYRTPA